MGMEGALWAAPVADVIGMIVAGGLVINFFRKLGRGTEISAQATTITSSCSVQI